MRWLRQVWDVFSRAMMAFGHFVSKYIITPVLYFGLGALFTLPTRASDPLKLKLSPGRSRWLSRAAESHDDLTRARSMY
ncbi:MAG: hypothetical protein HUU35_03985 [Armatimonadetes bacterium]|nr:hypothetical protein [Armatimonadota bacterium]